MNILFWNTDIPEKGDAKSDTIDSCLLNLVIENTVDLLILSEYGNSIEQLCRVVSNLSGRQYVPLPNYSGSNKIKGMINGKYNIQPLKDSSRYQIVKISTVYYELIVAMIHSDSKMFARNNRQEEILRWFNRDIIFEQEAHKCNNVIAIGDFNVNPFEDACLDAGVMFAVPFLEDAISKPREMDGRVYPKFYNPTWRFFGNTAIPYTTYYYSDSGDMANCYWNAIDQVMIRPALVKAFAEDKMRIISITANHQMLRNGRPDKKMYSDHLPLFCVLKEELI